MSDLKFKLSPSTDNEEGHRWYELQIEGLPVIKTKFSHGRKEGRRLEGLIARQLRVRKPFFDAMMRCNQDREAFYQQIRNDPYPPFEHRR